MEARLPTRFYSGTSNIVVPLKQSDYPPEMAGASRLTYYASLFPSLEVNATFYKLPRPLTVEKWSQSVPENFRFSLKVSKSITHVKGLQFSSADVTAFAAVAAAANTRRGSLLVQLPPSVKRDREEELNALLENLSEEAPGWPIAVEFRDNSWYTGAIYRMLQQYRAVVVEHDMLACPAPLNPIDASFSYLRFHGPDAGYRGSYSDAFLQVSADRIAGMIHDGKDVYVYFNNTLGAALQNLQKLNELVAARAGGA